MSEHRRRRRYRARRAARRRAEQIKPQHVYAFDPLAMLNEAIDRFLRHEVLKVLERTVGSPIVRRVDGGTRP